MTVKQTGEKALDRYRAELEIALRSRRVDGARIGAVLAEVEAHVGESGEDPVQAFGPATQYARSVPGRPPRTWWENGLWLVGGAVAGLLLVDGIVGLVRGQDGVLGVPAWVCVGVAVLMFSAFSVMTPVDPVIDPRSGRRGGSHGVRARILATVVLAVLCVVAVTVVLQVS